MLSIRAVRIATLIVCTGGIAGMIVTSALDHNGAAITFGLVTAVAVLCSMVAKAVTTAPAGAIAPIATVAPVGDVVPEDLAAMVERQIGAVIAEGAAEASVRQLVGEAVRLGRALGQDDR